MKDNYLVIIGLFNQTKSRKILVELWAWPHLAHSFILYLLNHNINHNCSDHIRPWYHDMYVCNVVFYVLCHAGQTMAISHRFAIICWLVQSVHLKCLKFYLFWAPFYANSFLLSAKIFISFLGPIVKPFYFLWIVTFFSGKEKFLAVNMVVFRPVKYRLQKSK